MKSPVVSELSVWAWGRSRPRFTGWARALVAADERGAIATRFRRRSFLPAKKLTGSTASLSPSISAVELGVAQTCEVSVMSTSETKERAIRLVFPDGGDWSRWYSTRDTARYLGKTAAAVRAWVNRYRAGQDHLT